MAKRETKKKSNQSPLPSAGKQGGKPPAGRVKIIAEKNTLPPAPAITLQASRRFWLIFLGGALAIAAIVQIYGYMTGWGNPERVIQRYFNSAQRLTLGKQYAAAIREYQKIIKKTKDVEVKRQSLIAIAELYNDDSDWQKAIAIYQQLRQEEPAGVMAAWAGLKISEAQQSLANYPAALEMYQSIEAQFPKSDWDAEARLGQGKVLSAMEKYDEAIAIFRKLEKDYHGGFLAAEALVQTGMADTKQGKLEAARDAYQKVVREYPDTMSDDAKKLLQHLDANQEPSGVTRWGNQK